MMRSVWEVNDDEGAEARLDRDGPFRMAMVGPGGKRVETAMGEAVGHEESG